MPRRRAAEGAYHYKARTAASAFKKKREPSSTSKAGRRQARAAAYRGGKLPKPGTAAAARRWQKFVPDTEEARFLARAIRDYELSGGRGANPYLEELKQLAEARYRAAYNTQQRERRPAKPKKKPLRVRVRAHWRRIAGRR